MSGKIGNNIGYSSGSVTAPSAGVEIRSDDPTLSEGLMWYNTTANTLKVARNITGWTTNNAMLTAVKQLGGAGTTAAGLSFGGNSGSRTTETEEFDGTSWSVSGVGNLATATTNGVGFGTQSAGLYANGQGASGNTDRTEEYDGSSWSSGGDLQEAMSNTSGFGTQTAGVRFGGEN